MKAGPDAPYAAGEPKARGLRAGKTFAKFGWKSKAERGKRRPIRRRGLALTSAPWQSPRPRNGALRRNVRFGISAMKVTIERSVLLKALGHIHRIVEKRNTIPILSNVLIEAADGSVALKSTDLDLEATEQIPGDVGTGRRDHGRRRMSSTTSCASFPRAPRSSLEIGRRDGTAPGALRPVALLSSGAARLRFPRSHPRRVLATASPCRRPI